MTKESIFSGGGREQEDIGKKGEGKWVFQEDTRPRQASKTWPKALRCMPGVAEGLGI